MLVKCYVKLAYTWQSGNIKRLAKNGKDHEAYSLIIEQKSALKKVNFVIKPIS